MRSDGSAAVCDVLYFVVLTIVWIHVIISTVRLRAAPADYCRSGPSRGV